MPSDEEVAAIAAEQEAGAVEAAAEENTDAGSDAGDTPAADESKEG